MFESSSEQAREQVKGVAECIRLCSSALGVEDAHNRVGFRALITLW